MSRIVFILIGILCSVVSIATVWASNVLSDGSVVQGLKPWQSDTILVPGGWVITRQTNTNDLHNVSFGTFERNGQTYTFSQQLDTNGNSTYRFVDGDGNPRGSVVCNVGESCTGDNPDAVNLAEDIQATAPYMIFVTEPVPGASCTCTAEGGCDGAVSNRLYTCVVVPGVGGFLQMIQWLSQWIMNIAILLGVLVIAAFGIAWSVAGNDDAEYKRKLKEWCFNICIGLAILFFFSFILRFIAPWIFV